MLENFLLGVKSFVERAQRQIVVVESNAQRREQLSELLAGPQVEIVAIESGAAAIELLRSVSADCIVLTPEPCDMSLAALAEQILALPALDPCTVFLYIGPDAPVGDAQRLSRLAQEFNLRFIDTPPKSRNETLAAMMRRMKICEEAGTGIDKVIEAIEAFQLPAPDFTAITSMQPGFTKATLFAQGYSSIRARRPVRSIASRSAARFVRRASPLPPAAAEPSSIRQW